MALRDKLLAAFAGLALLAVVGSFVGISLGDPPIQHKNPLTGFPTWHQPFVNEEKEVSFSFTMLALLFSLASSYTAHRATKSPSQSLTGFVTLPTGNEVSSTQINEMIQYYIDATSIAVFGYLIFDVGKIWAVVGALHNLLEVTLLLVIHNGGRVNSLSFGLYMFAYVCITIILSVYLKWPLDAVFFRWQGLCSDFALITMFIRMYLATKRQLKSFGNPDLHDEQLAVAKKAADQLSFDQLHNQSSNSLRTVALSDGSDIANRSNSILPTTYASGSNPSQHKYTSWKKFVCVAPEPQGHNATNGSTNGATNGAANGHNSTSAHESERQPRYDGEAPESVIRVQSINNNGDVGGDNLTIVALNQDSNIWGVQWRNPDQILILIAAATFHTIGNCVTTIWTMDTYAMAAFHISYGLAFPLYAYYLYVDNNALRMTKIYMPNFSKLKIFTGVCLALFGATVIIRLGLFVSSRDKSEQLNDL
ncbi:hypothetical protein BG011_009761 [Mortierella polycephala]|uniref:Uncharacterized protein n=1 Tax=Mortierella polycephala TaxID=41804 RepID=A0A9P6QHY4_9FUNG|nr:hypothetical protein BG011_009761 [Mortierella polycephala]